VVMVDGQGRLHPREFGLAAHLGVLLDVPTIGCAKSLLCGEFHGLAAARGSVAPVRYRGRVLGAAVRTRAGCRPVFVSSGHRIGLRRAIALTLAATGQYRLPEPTRQADRLSRQFRRVAQAGTDALGRLANAGGGTIVG